MPIKPCSKLWTDLNIFVHRKEIVNCCKRHQRHKPTIEEFKTLGADYWAFRPEVTEDKKHFVDINDFPLGCKECAMHHPASRYSTHNGWNEKTDQFFKALPTKDYITNIELSLSSTCNMTCMYCIPEVSSQWAKKLKVPENTVDVEWRDAMLESLFAYIEKEVIYRDKVEYTFLGGEPLLEPMFLEILEKIVALHAKTKKMPKVRFVTNGNVGPSVMDKFIRLTNSYPNVKWEVAMSIESIGQRAEIIREGLDFNRFETNFIKMLETDHVYVGILPTFNALSVYGLLDFHKWMAEKFVKYRGMEKFGKAWTVHLNLLYQPREISLGILPEEMKSYVDETIEWVSEMLSVLPDSKEKDKTRYILQLENMKKLIGEHRHNTKVMKKSKEWFVQQGTIHNRDYWKLLPEMQKIFDDVE